MSRHVTCTPVQALVVYVALMFRSRLLLVVSGCSVALMTPGSALAHGIHAGSTDSVADFVWLGIRHMVDGWDHVLFIAGIVLLAREVKLAAKLISLFVTRLDTEALSSFQSSVG